MPTFEGIENLDDINFTADDVEKKLENLKIGKSPGPDGIHPRVLKELAKELKMPLFIIFRKSLDTGILPKVWKIANVSPIFKKGSRHLAANYRPVSLTAVACKLMESLVKDAINTWKKQINCRPAAWFHCWEIMYHTANFNIGRLDQNIR